MPLARQACHFPHCTCGSGRRLVNFLQWLWDFLLPDCGEPIAEDRRSRGVGQHGPRAATSHVSRPSRAVSVETLRGSGSHVTTWHQRQVDAEQHPSNEEAQR